MLLTAKGKLLPSQEHKEKLLRTIQVVNQARNYISEVAFSGRLANKVKLQRVVYEEVRRRFGLPAQHTVRAIASVVNSYKAKKKRRWEKKIEFDTFSAIDLDQRLISFKGIDRASINTVGGRIVLPVVWGSYFRERVAFRRGHARLFHDRHKNEFYLLVAVGLPEGEVSEPQGFECRACNFRENADLVGAINISFRGVQSATLMPGALVYGQAPCSSAWSG